MTVMLLTCYLLLYLLAQAGFAVVLARAAASGPPPPVWPAVSILVAARNEAANLPRCLAALAALDYPPARLSVLLADDASTDATPQLLRQAAAARPHWRVLTITETRGRARGKANALDHLIALADSELLLCCDADVAVPPAWARTLVAEATHTGAALVVGTTLIEGSGWLARFQGLEWLQALATLHVSSRLGRPFTAMGNNQLLRKSAYLATGGYAQLPFSVTEDYQLFRAISRQGGRTVQVFAAGALAWSQPPESGAVLLRQRQRWLRGLRQLAAPALVGALALETLVLPVLGALALLGFGGLAAGLWGLRIVLRGVLLRIGRRRLGLAGPSVGEVLAFEGYLLLSAGAMAGLGLWPGPVVWKGRRF